MNDKKNIWRNFAGKGYYIALILCAVAIGISGYLYYRNASSNDAPLSDPAVDAGNQSGSNVDAMATDPSGGALPNETTGQSQRPTRTGLPVSGETVAGYAMDCLSYNATTRDWRTHDGIDITAAAGTPVCAAADGVVYTTYEDDSMGMTVVIRHDGGYVTTYSSLDSELKVSAGDTVKLGQTIGCVGSSALLETAIGDHVHFCVTLNDEPIDPAEFFALS